MKRADKKFPISQKLLSKYDNACIFFVFRETLFLSTAKSKRTSLIRVQFHCSLSPKTRSHYPIIIGLNLSTSSLQLQNILYVKHENTRRFKTYQTCTTRVFHACFHKVSWKVCFGAAFEVFFA